MSETLAQVEARIRDLEEQIAAWSRTNSQSNPGAMMELRALKKELAAAILLKQRFG